MVISTVSISSEKSFVEIMLVESMGKFNSSLDGRVVSCAVPIRSQFAPNARSHSFQSFIQNPKRRHTPVHPSVDVMA